MLRSTRDFNGCKTLLLQNIVDTKFYVLWNTKQGLDASYERLALKEKLQTFKTPQLTNQMGNL